MGKERVSSAAGCGCVLIIGNSKFFVTICELCEMYMW